MKLLRLFLVSILLTVSFLAFAQGQKVTGVLLDRSNGEPLPYATVSIFEKDAKSSTKYALSTADGKVSITGVKKGTYTLKVELMGYKTLTQEIKVSDKGFDMGTLMVSPDQKVLDAAKVTDVGNPIVVKKDTIEYNASSFKTTDNDMLIDLLKKLPGIEVESDGTITANGETIKKITIDGKTFFLDDPQLASKNIPSKIIEKVKVVEKKSDQAMFTGIDDGEEETIIDLNIKKGMMKGWFGNIMGGGGHDIPAEGVNNLNDWRWQGAGFVGNFTDQQQTSIILNGNNTNNRGFNDMASSMMGNMRGGGRRGMGRNGGTGITTSWMAGANTAWNLLDNRMELAGNYLYNGSIKDVLENSEKQTFKNSNEILNYTTNGINRTSTQGHRFGLRLDHKFSDNTSLLFEPQFNLGYGDFSEVTSFNTTRDSLGTVSDVNNGLSSNVGYNNNWTANGHALLRQRLGKPGRTITFNVRYNFSHNFMDGVNESLTHYESGADSTVYQSYLQNQNSSMLRGGVTYTEPIAKNWYAEVNYNYTWQQQTSNKDTYIDPERTIRDDVYSKAVLNISQTHRAGLNFMYQKEKLRAQIGADVVPTNTYNKTNGKEYRPGDNGWVYNWAPRANFSYDFNDNSNIRFFYYGNSSQPSTTQLMPVPDKTDPTNISLGNPYLTPYFTHSLRGMYRYTNKKTFTSVNAFLDGSAVQNPISTANWYDNDGTQYLFADNGPNSYNANLRVMVNSPIAKSKFSIFSMTRFGYSNSSNFVMTGDIDMSKYFIGGDKFNFNYDLFHADHPSLADDPAFTTNLTQSLTFVERLRFTFRNDIVELIAGARTRMTKSWYSINTSNPATWNNQAEASMNWTIPGGINLVVDYNFNWYNGYTTKQEPTSILNAEISKLLFKDRMTLSLKGYDLIGQSRAINVSDTSNYHQETTNNTLGRYIVLSLTYRFGSFNKLRDKMSQGGPGGPRGGFGGPGGPGMGPGPR